MSDVLSTKGEPNASGVYRLPLHIACFLLAVCLVSSQINPCDATSVALGSTVTFIMMSMGIGFFVAVDSVLVPQEARSDKLGQLFIVSLTVFGIWILVCTLLVPGQGNARFAFNGCWQWISEGILVLSIARLCRRTRIARSLCTLMLACAAGTVAYACYQYFIDMPAFRAMFAADPNSILEKMDIIPGSSAAMQFANRLQSLEPTGPFALTNSLAGFMSAWLVFLVLFLVSQSAAAVGSTSVKKIKWSTLLLGMGLIGGMSMTLLLTKSRSAWLATCVGLLASCFLQPAIRQSGWAFTKRFRVVLLVVATCGVVALSAVLARDPFIVSEAWKSLSYRFDYWRGALALIQAKPWTGYGVANFQQNYDRVKVITASESPADPHNFLLETALAGGYPLLLSLVFLLAIFMLKLHVASQQDGSEGASPFCSKEGFVADGRLAIVLGGLGCSSGILLFSLLIGDGDSFVTSLLFVAVSIVVFVWVDRLHWFDESSQIVSIGMLSAGVVFIHLIASGGWMQPGLMNSVCVLVGLAFGANPIRPDVRLTNTGRHVSQRHWFGLLFVIVLIAGFARTMWFPVLGSSAVVNAVSAGLLEPDELSGILAVDSYDPELARLVANRCATELRRSDLSSAMRQKFSRLLDEFCEEYIRRAPNQWMPNAQCGQWLAILVDSEPKQDLSVAKELQNKIRVYAFFSKAAELYPNSIQTQLQAAVGAAWCEKYPKVRVHCEKVEEIDRETPHSDRKLASVFVFFPKQLDTKRTPLEEGSWLEQQEGNAKGEPILRWLRTIVP